MRGIDTSFAWNVPAAGFQWRDGPWSGEGNHANASCLLMAAASRDNARRSYRPLQDVSGLFRIFADIAPNKEGILKFATQYGGLGVAAHYTPAEGPAEEKMLGRQGESLERWMHEIGLLRQAVTLLDLVRVGDETGLSRLMHWRSAVVEGEFGVSPDSWVYRHPGQDPMPIHGPYTPSDILTPAIGLVGSWANAKLRGHTYLALSSDPARGKTVLEVKVGTLLTAMWMQLAWAIVEPTDYRLCRTCGRWFAVPRNDERKAEQVFCQDACKSRDYRQRKARALELAGQGRTAKQIASEIGTDIDTVKKWIRTKR